MTSIGNGTIVRSLSPADPRPLGVFRVSVSAVALIQIWTLWPYLLQLYGNFGFIQWAVMETAGDPWLPSIGKICLLLEPLGASSTVCVHGVFVVYGLSVLGLGVGVMTRPCAIGAWLTHSLTVNSGYISLYGVDTMLHICLFYCACMPVGTTYSLDGLRHPAPPAPSAGATLSLRVLQLHLCVIYFNTGLAKARGDQWWTGEALWRALMQPQFAVFDVSWLAHATWLPLIGGWIVMLIELGYPVFIWPRATRPLWVAATAALHLGIGAAMGLWLFSAVMIVMTVAAFGGPWLLATGRTSSFPKGVSRRTLVPRAACGVEEAMPTPSLPRWATLLTNLVRALIRWLLGLRVDDFAPRDGWPGSIITIAGHGFSPNRDANVVTIGGIPALVVDAQANQLVVVAGEKTPGGPVTVAVGPRRATAGDFTVRPYPDATKLAQSGAPRFFHGPQDGTPQKNVANQKVLVVIAYPTDHDPGTPAQRTATRNAIIGRFDTAKLYWDQASYGSTTWVMTYSDWIAMPQDRRFYFWEQGDVDDARRALLRDTSRPVAWSGTTVAHAVSGGFIITSHPSAGTLTTLSGVLNPDGSAVMALEWSSTTLYAGTEQGGFFVYNVSNPAAPVLQGSVMFPSRSVWDIALSGTTAVLALGDGGLGLVDVTTPTAPATLAAGSTVSAWALAVEAVGTRIYAGRGDGLRIFDLAGSTLTQVANVPAGDWVTGVSVDSTACLVSTDGNGVRVFETDPGGAIERATFLGVTRVRTVRVSGTRAALAANDGGLVVLDVSDLTAPAALGTLATTKPAYGLAVSGSEVLLAGAVDVMAVAIADPANPSVTATDAGVTAEPDLATLRNQLSIALDSQAFVKSSDRLFIDTLEAYFTATATTVAGLNAYQGVILVVNGGFLRGQSWTTNGFADSGNSLTFNDTKGVIYFATGAAWGRIAHEIGHWLGMWDIYAEWNADGTYLPGTAAPWCLAGNHDAGPLFCAHHMHDIMGFYASGAPGDPNSNVVELTWSPSSSADETFDIVAHDAAQDVTASRVHVVKLVAAAGLIYYLEVRQAPVGPVFDQNIDLPPGDIGRVIVLRVTQGTSISNTFERPIMLVDRLAVGGTFVDAARNLIVTVESKEQDTPLVYRVRVRWNQPVPGDPNGQFDLTVTPWTTDNWETVDLWVDSLRNNTGATPVYEFHEAGAPAKPILNGDRPWVKHKNTIQARVRNTGPQAVPEVWVSCYVNSPPGIGDNGSWALLETQQTSLTGHDPAVPGSGEAVLTFEWAPAKGEHTCIKVAVLPQIGEIATDNNSAQENVFTFDSAASSSHQPVLLEAVVRSPFTVWRKVDLVVRGLPIGWHAVVDTSWVWVPGKGTHPVTAVIWTDLNTPTGKDKRIPPLALPRIEGWTSFDHRYLPIGGLLAAVKAVKRVEITVRAEGGAGHLTAWGEIEPPLAAVPITIEVTDATGKSWLVYTQTDGMGRFRTTAPAGKALLAKGKYAVQAFTTAGASAAEAESVVVAVTVS